MKHHFPYKWKLKDANFTRDKGTVFSCFACGGGSTMGYKLAGYDVIGCNELDPRMNQVYVKNLHPRINYLCDIRSLADCNAFPEELYHLNILDGSPPCSSFSSSGVRSRDWGKEKYFREGQQKQVLDTLFFDFIRLAKKLQPKVVIAENVKGLMLGNAKDYVRRIYQGFDDAGYNVQHYLLDAQNMGVPQRRQRVFFVCLRKDLVGFVSCEHTLFEQVPYLDLVFKEAEIPFNAVADGLGDSVDSPKMRQCWEMRKVGDKDLAGANERCYSKRGMFNNQYVYLDKVCPTLAGRKDCLIRFDMPKYTSKSEVCCISSFPQDYDFCSQKPHYVCGMSVPPVMMAQVASRIYEQWLSKIN